MTRLVAGVGCSSAASASEIVALLEASLAEGGLRASDLACVATVDTRARLPALMAAARHFSVPLRCFSADELRGVEAVPSPSETVRAHAGLSSVAEAVALRAGPLRLEKRKSAHATCAIASVTGDFEIESFGRPA